MAGGPKDHPTKHVFWNPPCRPSKQNVGCLDMFLWSLGPLNMEAPCRVGSRPDYLQAGLRCIPHIQIRSGVELKKHKIVVLLEFPKIRRPNDIDRKSQGSYPHQGPTIYGNSNLGAHIPLHAEGVPGRKAAERFNENNRRRRTTTLLKLNMR